MKRAIACIALCWLWLLVLDGTLLRAQNVITTVAGSVWVFRGDGAPATSAPLGVVADVALDAAGNIFAADRDNCLVVKVPPSGILSVVAGNGICEYSGDGGPATSASLSAPTSVALDSTGNLYIADNRRIRRVTPAGIISTVAGNGLAGYSGDGGPATSASLGGIWGVAVDSAGNLYISDTGNHRVRKVSPSGIITTVAGDGFTNANGSGRFSGDGGPAASASLNYPNRIALDAAGNLYIADTYNNRVRKISPAGIIITVAGNGAEGFSGDGGPATSASLNNPQAVTLDSAGNLYIVDSWNHRVRKVSSGGTITAVAGNGTSAYSGEGGLATAASLCYPMAAAADSAGNLYIADSNNFRVRKVTPGGIISRVAGNGDYSFSGDGGPARSATLNDPIGMTFDSAGNLYFVENSRMRKITPGGTISTLAGTGVLGFAGDGGPATSAALNWPCDIEVDSTGNLYIADTYNNRVRKISPAGIITTVAGNGTEDFSGDGGPATSASLSNPQAVALDSAGNLYIADSWSHRVRKVSTSGTITTIAGSGTAGFSGDGGAAASASLRAPAGVAVDTAGNLYIADYKNNRIRKVSAGGIITTVAGDGRQASFGDGGPAISASLNKPFGIVVDSAGNLYIADLGNGRIRLVTPGGTISTVAGNGTAGYTGDGGLAINASLRSPYGVEVDSAGNLYIADTQNNRIRKVLAAAPSFSVAPAKLSFSAQSGAAAIGAQQLAVSGAVTGLAWSALVSTQSGGTWLSVSPPVGALPGTIGVSVDVSNLAAGTYQGTVMVQVPLAVPSTQTVAVELTVTAALPAQLAVEPGSLTFEAFTGTTSSPAQTLRIRNTGGGTLNWTAATASGSNWLSVSPSSGSATAASPGTVQVSVNLSGLAVGLYSGTVIVSSGGQTVRAGVTLLVTTVTQTILVSQAGLLFTGVQGGGVVPPQSIGILNTGQGTMNWTMEATTLGGGNWLTVTPASGKSDASSTEIPLVDVGADTTGLAAGRYSGMLRVRSSAANNSPQIVSVELNVLSAGSNPGVLVRPTGLIFAARAGSSPPGSQTVKLGTAAPGTLEARSGLLTLDGGDWLQAVPQNLVLSSSDRRTVTVQPTLGAMTPGVYHGAITFLFGDGSVQTVNVLFLVLKSSSATSAGLSLLARDDGAALFDATCTPTKLLAMHRTLGAGFTAPAGSPMLIEVQVADDCATVITGATVTASFSSGDPLLVMTSLRNGTYVGTWRPLTTASQVTVTVRATLPPLTTAEVQAQGQVSGSSTMPLLFNGGIVNAASYAPAAAIAPGSIVAAFGRSMATGVTTSGLPLEQTLGGATLNIGGIEAPLFFSSDGQINAQLPFNLTPNSRPQAYIRLRTASGAEMISVPESFTIAAAQPGIFTMNQAGSGQGAIIDNATWKLVDASNPAKAGDYVQVYATGLGQVTPSVTAGQAAPGSPLSETTVAVTATVGGKAAKVIFAGLAPGFAGLYQVNLQVPEGVTPGDAVPLILTQGGVSSNTATLAIR